MISNKGRLPPQCHFSRDIYGGIELIVSVRNLFLIKKEIVSSLGTLKESKRPSYYILDTTRTQDIGGNSCFMNDSKLLNSIESTKIDMNIALNLLKSSVS